MYKILLSAAALMLGASGNAYAQIPAPTETITITAAPPYSVTGELYILKADTNAPALHNPVLVVEGFDLDNSMNWPELYTLLNQENLVTDMLAFGRDLAVLSFTDSTVNIHSNAALTAAAVDYINTQRANSSDKFTAVGASLGGLTLREALVNMPNHDVDTWVSFDAPHEGANIPLGVQEYLEFFAPNNDSAAGLLDALDRPAARQMLLAHHSHPDGLTGGSLPERSDYMTAMAATGYPTNCKSIAISNGSGFGDKQPFSPGEKIINWTDSGGFFEPSIASEVFALPTTPGTVFTGEISLIIPIDSATVNAYHPLSFDNAPGGARSTFLQLFTNIPPDQISADDYCNYTNHCFIPTVSALGIPIGNLESNLAANAALTDLSPFDEIHYATNNEDHVEINLRNKRWLMRAALESHDTDSDGLDDYEEYLIGTDYDSAASRLTIELTVGAVPYSNMVEVAWAAYPNTQYDVWFADEPGAPWIQIDTIAPTGLAGITNLYEFPTTGSAGFFAVSGEPIDPVTD